MGTAMSTPSQTSRAHRILWIDLEGAPCRGVAIWDTAILHDTGSVRYVRWNTDEQRKRLRKSVPAELIDVITGTKYPRGTTHRIDQDAKLCVVAHAVCDEEYEVELAEHLRVAHDDASSQSAACIVSWSSYDLRALRDAVLSPADAKLARDQGLHVNALQRAKHYFTVPSFSLAKKGPGSIRKALRAADFADTPGCGPGPHCALYDALVMRDVCEKAVAVLRTETDGNMTMDRFLGIERSDEIADAGARHATVLKHNLSKSAVAPLPSVASNDNNNKVSDVDKVFDIQRQIDGAHAAWVLAHQHEEYWDDKGKLRSATSRDFKSNVRRIMGPVWCRENGHRLNATRTKEGVLRLLARAARVV